MEQLADAIREVTAAIQIELETGRRSTHIDANDLIDILLSIADKIEPPLPPRTRPKKGEPGPGW